MPVKDHLVRWLGAVSSTPATPSAGYVALYADASGQVWAKNSAGTAYKLTNDTAAYMTKAANLSDLVDVPSARFYLGLSYSAKGDILAANNLLAPTRLPVGSNGQILTADSAAATGLAWATSPGRTKIGETTLGVNSATITVSSIPATYRELEIVANVHSASGGTSDGLRLRLNGSSAANYTFQEEYASGTGITASRNIGQTWFFCGEIPVHANIQSNNLINLARYADTSYWTLFKNFSGSDIQNTGPWTFFETGYWGLTTTVNSLSFSCSTGANFRSGSRVAVYGIN